MSELAPIATSIPEVLLRWVPLADAARLLGHSERHARRLCGDKWFMSGQARAIDGKWEVRSDAHALLAHQPQAVDGGLSDLRPFTKEQREQALQCKVILSVVRELSASIGKWPSKAAVRSKGELRISCAATRTWASEVR